MSIASGAWVVEYEAERRRHYKAVVASKPRTLDEIHASVGQPQKRARWLPRAPSTPTSYDTEDEAKLLDGFFLVFRTRSIIIINLNYILFQNSWEHWIIFKSKVALFVIYYLIFKVRLVVSSMTGTQHLSVEIYIHDLHL